MSKEAYHDMIKQLRDERYDVGKVYLGGKDDKDTIEKEIDMTEKTEIVREIGEIADSMILGIEMEADNQIPVYSMEKELSDSQAIDLLLNETAEVVATVDMSGLIALMTRNWKALKELTYTEIRNAMKNVYSEVDEVVMEAAIDTAMYVVRAA